MAWQKQQSQSSPSEFSDQTGHPHTRIRDFFVRSVDNNGPNLSYAEREDSGQIEVIHVPRLF